jgi:hypothetical protein
MHFPRLSKHLILLFRQYRPSTAPRVSRLSTARIGLAVPLDLRGSSRHYGEIVKVADEHFAQASKKLGATVDGVDEHLQNLMEALESVKVGTDGNRA